MIFSPFLITGAVVLWPRNFQKLWNQKSMWKSKGFINFYEFVHRVYGAVNEK
jgi:hypothetical protein